MGRDVEGKVVTGGVSLLSVRSGNGGAENIVAVVVVGGASGSGLRIYPASVGGRGNV
jgi:hypothetical protein